MSTVQEIKALTPKLRPRELAELRDWLEDFCEHRREPTDEVKAALDSLPRRNYNRAIPHASTA